MIGKQDLRVVVITDDTALYAASHYAIEYMMAMNEKPEGKDRAKRKLATLVRRRIARMHQITPKQVPWHLMRGAMQKAFPKINWTTIVNDMYHD